MLKGLFRKRRKRLPMPLIIAASFGMLAELALIAVFTLLIASRHALAGAVFAGIWAVVFVVAHLLEADRAPTAFFLVDRLLRIVVLSALALGWFSTTIAALITLATSGVFVIALLISHWILSRHPDAETDPTVKAYAFFISAPEEAHRLARTCYLISRTAIPWAGFLLWSRDPLWVAFIAQYVLAGLTAHVIDPRALLKGALRDNPHDLSLRQQVNALESFASRIAESLLGKNGRRR